MYTIDFTEQELIDLLEAEGNDMMEYPAGVKERIVRTLCPTEDSHDQVIRKLKLTSHMGWTPFQVNSHCRKCGKRYWVIRPANTITREYDYWPEDRGLEGRVRFKPGDNNDPRLVDLMNVEEFD